MDDLLPDFSALDVGSDDSGALTLSPSASSPTTLSVSSPAASQGTGSSWLSDIGNFLNTAGQVVQNGAAVAAATASKVQSLSFSAPSPAAPPAALSTNPSWLVPALIAGAVLILILVVKRKG